MVTQMTSWLAHPGRRRDLKSCDSNSRFGTSAIASSWTIGPHRDQDSSSVAVDFTKMAPRSIIRRASELSQSVHSEHNIPLSVINHICGLSRIARQSSRTPIAIAYAQTYSR